VTARQPPKVSVITPTWRRHDLLLDRCVPSVQAQAHPGIEHIVISDGPDPELKGILMQPQPWPRRLWYHELPVHDEALHWGGPARTAGIELAAGEYITYCDDDDALRPEHCTLLAGALDAHPEAGFAVSRMLSHTPGGDLTIGTGPLAGGDVGTPMLMHRRSVLDVAGWGSPDRFEDWNLVWAWISAGISYVRVLAETSDVWPSIFR
jgi:glycosyltransferase involved in cell wall biosynthesis